VSDNDRSVSKGVIAALQRRIAAAFGLTDDDLRERVAEMLPRSGAPAASYWLQLVLAMGIATLGLVLGSTAVVIGGMLVSPLMGPIVELGMGLAVGSPFLVLRSAIKVGLSVVVVVTCSMVLVRLLPFHEVTQEIASRTSPTALDLAVAVFCAAAAAFTTMKKDSSTSATAAGTAIGIALVPPLGVIGYGLGTNDSHTARGAALLFTANFAAIVLFAVVAFVLFGFNRVEVHALEEAELQRTGGQAVGRAARSLYRFFHSRYGSLMRFVTPLVLVGAIFIPLRSALREVAWEVATRSAVRQILGGLSQQVVRSTVSVERHSVDVRIVIIGSADRARALKQQLSTKIAAAAGTAPFVEVVAVPDLETLKRAVVPIGPPSPPPPQAPVESDLASLRTRTVAALTHRWPTEAAGTLQRWRLDLTAPGKVELHVFHLGAPLGAAAERVLSVDLTSELGADEVRVIDHAFDPAPYSASHEHGEDWIVGVLTRIGRLAEAGTMRACIEVPTAEKEGEAEELRARLVAALQAATLPLGGRAQVIERAGDWTFRMVTSECEPRASSDAGPLGAADSTSHDAAVDVSIPSDAGATE